MVEKMVAIEMVEKMRSEHEQERQHIVEQRCSAERALLRELNDTKRELNLTLQRLRRAEQAHRHMETQV